MKFLLFFILTFSLLTTGYAREPLPPEALQIRSQEHYHNSNFALSDQDWRWLGEKRVLTIGVWRPEIPPLNLFTESGKYEGIGADYVLLVAQYLGLQTNIQRFTTRDEAISELENGSVDMVVDPAGFPISSHSNLVVSRNFVTDHPVLVHRQQASKGNFEYQPGMRLAISNWYIDDSWLTTQFPGVRIVRFNSDTEAMASVAFDENDFYVGNLITASYLMTRNYSHFLELQHVFPDHDTGSRFILRRDEDVLLKGIDKALQAIPRAQSEGILHKWSEEAELWRTQQTVAFTEREQRWIARNPVVPVGVNAFYAPFTMVSQNGSFYGITADILRLISLRTGINFNPQPSESVDSMFSHIGSKQVAFLGSMTWSDTRDNQLLFSRPYFTSPFVLVVKSGIDHPVRINRSMTLALVKGNALIPELRSRYPGINLLLVDNASLALQSVKEGTADGAVHTLIGAHYMIARYFQNELKIANTLGEHSAEVGFAVRRDQPELLSILNKALADIPSNDVSRILAKWQTRPDVKLDTWEIYRKQFWLVVAMAAVVAATFLGWVWFLRRQVAGRRRAQNQMQTELLFSDTLLNSVSVPVYVVNQRGELLRYNPAWSAFFDDEQREKAQQNIGNEDNPLHAIWQQLQPLMAEGQLPHSSTPLAVKIDSGESERSVLHYAVPWGDEQQPFAGLICNWIDLTRHEQLMQELSEARERAEQANRAKSTFLATMSHEIRTPVSAIIGLLELAVKTAEEEPGEEDPIRVAWESSRSLMGIIGDILDMARIESGRLELSPEWVRTTELLPPVLRVFEGLARQKGLRLRCTLPPTLPGEVFIDPLRFRQILSNLVGNAIKFTEQGGIDIAMDIAPRDAETVVLQIAVQDSGQGIGEEALATIFDPWEQTEVGRKQSGSGLGLAICAQLVEMMGGDISLTSESGRGTTVRFSIPVQQTNKRPEARATEVAPALLPDRLSLNILTADDHPANRMLLRRQLTHLGHRVTEACDGEEAFGLWQKGDFDLVITDCSMPVIDGIGLTKLIREHQKQPVVILGLTANTWPEERNRCIEAGMDDCLFKPLQLPQLQGMLEAVAKKLASQGLTLRPSLGSLLSLDNLREFTQHDDEWLKTLLQTTLDANREDALKARDCLEIEDWPELGSCVHRLHGMAQIIGATAAAKACKEVEELCRQKAPDPERIHTTWQETEHHLNQLNDAIASWLEAS